ncbi:class I SAM-dependent methyltransferase [Kibdelosporangium phytohabitans]|uniref:Methyltransferase n=1 Tax=Kibdelosporangium phytohabitans TaxID=860235 RepID=A0A0N9ICQ0_9PSEU|nr:class I SAM-dependent methyltransferase [Kibdelosporangium phytohabitans]ALG12402.1 methyltransferase [Kibdelosporangium phytohabitans]MBE1463983.1 ubiquinone/menaquinone biosynthesis C-methylase UbiE [Kibdelosporangium phytohabitans]
MLTVHFGRLRIRTGDRVLDLGCGGGRHAFEAAKHGADVIALDLAGADLKDVRDMFAAMAEVGESSGATAAVRASGLALPFPDASFDHVIAAEILEHVPDDVTMITEAARVLKPGGLVAVTVPRWWPERVCWALSDAYHQVEGGHVRIYRRRQLMRRLRDAGLEPVFTHHAHALHSPYWWLKCAVGPEEETALVRLYHRFLLWEIIKRPRSVRVVERALNPLLGKSFVVYARKTAP